MSSEFNSCSCQSNINTTYTCPGAHPASYPVGNVGGGGLCPVIKWPGHETDDSPPSSAEVKNTWSYTSNLPQAFMAWYLGTRTTLFYL
jgi:hypothetical protein